MPGVFRHEICLKKQKGKGYVSQDGKEEINF